MLQALKKDVIDPRISDIGKRLTVLAYQEGEFTPAQIAAVTLYQRRLER